VQCAGCGLQTVFSSDTQIPTHSTAWRRNRVTHGEVQEKVKARNKEWWGIECEIKLSEGVGSQDGSNRLIRKAIQQSEDKQWREAWEMKEMDGEIPLLSGDLSRAEIGEMWNSDHIKSSSPDVSLLSWNKQLLFLCVATFSVKINVWSLDIWVSSINRIYIYIETSIFSDLVWQQRLNRWG
jgi:hypothetical protein